MDFVQGKDYNKKIMFLGQYGGLYKGDTYLQYTHATSVAQKNLLWKKMMLSLMAIVGRVGMKGKILFLCA